MFCPIPGLGFICDAAGAALNKATDGVVAELASSLLAGFGDLIKQMLTFFIDVKTPDVSKVSVVGQLANDVNWVTTGVFTIGLIIAAGMLIVRRAKGGAEQMGFAAARVIFAQGALIPVVGLATGIGDIYATWIIGQTGGAQFGANVLSVVTSLGKVNGGALLFIAGLGILSSALQVILMWVRVGSLALLAISLAPLAAASDTDAGQHAYKRALHWLYAFVLYKPVAATVYAGAFALVGANTGDAQWGLAGWSMLLLAILALPALMAVVAPAVEPSMRGAGHAAFQRAGQMAVGAAQLAGGVARLGAAKGAGVVAGGQVGGPGTPSTTGATPTGGTTRHLQSVAPPSGKPDTSVPPPAPGGKPNTTYPPPSPTGPPDTTYPPPARDSRLSARTAGSIA